MMEARYYTPPQLTGEGKVLTGTAWLAQTLQTFADHGLVVWTERKETGEDGTKIYHVLEPESQEERVVRKRGTRWVTERCG